LRTPLKKSDIIIDETIVKFLEKTLGKSTEEAIESHQVSSSVDYITTLVSEEELIIIIEELFGNCDYHKQG
jgi:hypothetical protein